MLAVIYLALAFWVGRVVSRAMVPSLDGTALPATQRFVAPWMIRIPTSFLTGTLLVTWTTYMTGWLLKSAHQPLFGANIIVMSVLGIGLPVGCFFKKRGRSTDTAREDKAGLARSADQNRTIKERWPEFLVIVVGLAVGTAIMLHTCRIDGDTLILGRTAFGDLNIHLGTARSFSRGSNFPTGYVAYAGTDIRYHFMFFFLVGNLEYLGLRLDWALNLPSILSFTSVVMLLYSLGTVIGRNRSVGALAVLFFLFRSSPAAFQYVAHLKASDVSSRIAEVLQTRQYIGLTAHEPWGIWNLNVYVVERHFSFALGLVLIAVLYLVRVSRLDTETSLLRPVTAAGRKSASVPR